MRNNTKSFSIRKKRFNGYQLLKYIVLCLITAVILAPMMIIIFSAFKTLPEIGQLTPLSLPHHFYALCY